MYKKIINIPIIIIIIVILVKSFINYRVISSILITTSIIFIKNVFPFLFTMIFINNLLIELNLPYYINKVFKNKYIYIFIMSMLCGAPSNAIIIEKFLKKNELSCQDASLLLSFTSFNSPLFLYSYLNIIFNDKKSIITILLFIYIENIILFVILNKKLDNKKVNITFINNNVFLSISKSIINAMQSMISIYATILIFAIISNILLPKCGYLNGFIEVTQGLSCLSVLNISIQRKKLLVLAILTFLGLSIHVQICSVLSNYKINYLYFYMSRIIFLIINLTILFI